MLRFALVLGLAVAVLCGPPLAGAWAAATPAPGHNVPPPPGYRAIRGHIPRAVVLKAVEILHGSEPIGTQIPLVVNGKDCLFAVEWHKHAATDNVPERLKHWHRGVTVYERRP